MLSKPNLPSIDMLPNRKEIEELFSNYMQSSHLIMSEQFYKGLVYE